MYDYIKGRLVELSPHRAIVESNSIGYAIIIPINIFADLSALKGQDVMLFVSYVVREDSQRLFGFLGKSQRDTFDILSDISGIGPKTALSIIGHLSLRELEKVVYEQDSLTLCKVPGVGKKTSERLLIEMKDKLKHLKGAHDPIHTLSKEEQSLMSDALAALLHLGYHNSIAHPAIKKVLSEGLSSRNLADLITFSLKVIREKK